MISGKTIGLRSVLVVPDNEGLNLSACRTVGQSLLKAQAVVKETPAGKGRRLAPRR